MERQTGQSGQAEYAKQEGHTEQGEHAKHAGQTDVKRKLGGDLPVITISRAYAAYGRTIASALSERLGLMVYDKDFVKETARQSGYSEEDIAREGEQMSRISKFMNSLLNNVTIYTSSYDGIYRAQREVVLSLAKKPCIIVGRCAEHILMEEQIPCFRIFLHADKRTRLNRAAQLEENKGLDPKKVLAKRDELRETYYRHYTGNEMGDYRQYDLSLDTGSIGVDTCVDLICEAVMGWCNQRNGR